MSEVIDCVGCIYHIVGERKDKLGYTMKTSECLCEKYMAASCIPTYQFDESDIFKGKMKIEKSGLVFYLSKPKKLRDNISYSLSESSTTKSSEKP
jgi:hypothetical protein